MENIDDIQIGLTKFRANSSKYFSLFDKHIPMFDDNGKGRKILLLGLNNEGMMLKCCALNKESKYWVADQSILSETLPLVGPEYDFKFFDGNLELYNIIKNCDMKFDCIIMNPPYEKNLHLKILAEAITHLKDDESICVNLSPVRWLQDPLAKYKKNSDYHRFEENISKHIESLNVIQSKDAQHMFDMNIFTDIGIYACKLNCYTIKFDYQSFNRSNFANYESIFLKLYSFVKDESNAIKNYLQYNVNDGIRVVQSAITGQKGCQNCRNFYYFGIKPMIWVDGVCDGKKYENVCGGIKRAKAKQANKKIEMPLTYKFNSIIEAKNFIQTYADTSVFMTFCGIMTKNDMHPQFKFLPWLGNVVNPRTGLKGYESEWTDDDLYKFFNITPDEQKIIEDTMAKYK